jgi:tRNA threonylcarbamoyladenosine biosynthesis protein TsaB
MKILGIDTSTMMGAVAVVEGDTLLAELRTNVSITHSERLMQHIDGLLSSAGLNIKDIDGFAVALGPGSFTGLRIGLAAAKALAYAEGKPIAGIPTLEALADNLPFCGYQVCPVLDARKQQVYAALYAPTADGRDTVFPTSVLTPQELAARITGPTVFLGDGAYAYRDFLKETLVDKAIFAPQACSYPSGAAVAFRGQAEIRAGRVADPMTLVPMYIRKSEAEEKAG